MCSSSLSFLLLVVEYAETRFSCRPPSSCQSGGGVPQYNTKGKKEANLRSSATATADGGSGSGGYHTADRGGGGSEKKTARYAIGIR